MRTLTRCPLALPPCSKLLKGLWLVEEGDAVLPPAAASIIGACTFSYMRKRVTSRAKYQRARGFKTRDLHSVQSVESSRHIFYVGHGPVVVPHHFLHEVRIASDLHTLKETSVPRQIAYIKSRGSMHSPGATLQDRA